MWINKQIDRIAKWLLADGDHWRWLAHVLEGGFVLLLAAILWSIYKASV